jgi:hypothetical protein
MTTSMLSNTALKARKTRNMEINRGNSLRAFSDEI